MKIIIEKGGKSRLETDDGITVPGVMSMTINSAVDAITTATVDMCAINGTIDADVFLGMDTLKKSAEYHGYELIEKDDK